MKLIWDKGTKTGHNPVGSYVYRYDHEGVARYVGRGANARWADHLTQSHNNYPPKRRYFEANLPEMTCSIVQDGLTEEEAGTLEKAVIAIHGFLFDGSGTLLNARDGSVIYGKRASASQRKKPLPFRNRLWNRLKREGKMAPNAEIRRVINHNPKRQRAGGSYATDHFDLYPAPGVPVTVAAHDTYVAARGYPEQFGHLTWDSANGFIAISLPKGETAAPGFVVPTRELLHRLALEVGTEEEWEKHCAFRAQQGGKVGG
jgi:hypothetical protein